MLLRKEDFVCSKPTEKIERCILAVGDKLMLIVNTLEPGALVPWHSHPHEQVSYVFKGRLTVKSQEGTYTVNEGEVLLFKSNEPHEVLNPGPEAAVVFEVFSPPREDFLKK
ncbi:MAG: hypothetical protein B7O98_00155 [Zestosphaera tikiterensis]|uniref:Cupin type-2 domain-containing protein n=1 Tax=Zestosphaera tikiterensis TaxID=1973259 RepID=A0A2R7YAI1_9CREN|nr:MAG: hypothetical protein B7O98_00155 [Zestosphaera tikiterensis]